MQQDEVTQKKYGTFHAIPLSPVLSLIYKERKVKFTSFFQNLRNVFPFPLKISSVLLSPFFFFHKIFFRILNEN